jgi:hypothetical protein
MGDGFKFKIAMNQFLTFFYKNISNSVFSLRACSYSEITNNNETCSVCPENSYSLTLNDTNCYSSSNIFNITDPILNYKLRFLVDNRLPK